MAGTGFGAGLAAGLAGNPITLPSGASNIQDPRTGLINAQAKLLEASGTAAKGSAEAQQIGQEIQNNTEAGHLLKSVIKAVFIPNEQGGMSVNPAFVSPDNPKQFNIGAMTQLLLQKAGDMQISGPAFGQAVDLIAKLGKVAPEIKQKWIEAGIAEAKKRALEVTNKVVKDYAATSKADASMRALTTSGLSSAAAAGQPIDLSKQSMEGLQAQAEARAAGSNINVNVPGAPTSGFQTKMQTAVATNMTTISLLDNLINTYDKSYSTYLGQAKKGFNEVMEKLGVNLSEDNKKYITEMSQWLQSAKRIELAYRQVITGTQVREDEKPEIRIASIDPVGDSPTEIVAKLKNMLKVSKAVTARDWIMSIRGLPPTDAVLASLPLDDPYLIKVADSLAEMFKHKPNLLPQKSQPSVAAPAIPRTGDSTVDNLLNNVFGGK